MKMIYDDTKLTKNWGIKLVDNGLSATICALDIRTGEFIAHVIHFGSDGKVVTSTAAFQALSEQGYNPYEHNNEWDEHGSIKIDKE